MAEESNLLTARIELSLRAIEKGAKAIQGAVDNVNEKTDFNALKNQFVSLADKVTSAASTIQSEIGKITKSIDLSQVGVNLQNLDNNVTTIMNSITEHLARMNETVKTTAQDANKADFEAVKNQLDSLKTSIEKFTTVANSGDLLKAFSGEKTASAVKSLKDYATALKGLSELNIDGLKSNLTVLATQQKNVAGQNIATIAGVNISGLLTQVKTLGENFKAVRVQVAGVAKVIEALGATDVTTLQNSMRALIDMIDKLKTAEFGKGNVRNIESYVKDLSEMIHELSEYTTTKDGKTVSKVAGLQNLLSVLRKIQESVYEIQKLVAHLPDEFAKTGATASDASKGVEKIEGTAEKTASKLNETVTALKDFNKALPTDANVNTIKNFGAEAANAKTNISKLVQTLANMNRQMQTADKNVNAGGIANIGKASASAAVEAQKLADAEKQLGEQAAKNNTGVASSMSIANSLAQITKGMTSVIGESGKMSITIGTDIASIANAMKALTGGDGLKNLAETLSGVNKTAQGEAAVSNIEKMRTSYENLAKAITDVGNAMSKMLVGSNMADVKNGAENDAVNKYNNIKMSIESAKASMEDFMQFDLNDEKSGVANFTEEMNKLGNLITRIFTTYSNYSAATNDFGAEIGATDFAEHLRTVSTQAQTSTINLTNMEPIVAELKGTIGQLGATCQQAVTQMSQMAQASNSEALTKMSEAFAQLQATIAGLGQINTVTAAISEMKAAMSGLAQDASLQKLNEALTGLTSATSSVKMSAEDIQAFKDALSGLAQSGTVEQIKTSVEGLSQAMLALPMEASVTSGFTEIRALMEGLYQMLPDVQQLQTVIQEMQTMSGNLLGGLYQMDETGNPIRPLLESLSGFNPANIEASFAQIIVQAQTLSTQLTEVKTAIDGVSDATKKIDANALNELTKDRMVKLDADQFKALTEAIKATTAEIKKLSDAITNLSPQQLEQVGMAASSTAAEMERAAQATGAANSGSTASRAGGEIVSLEALVAAYKEYYQLQIQLTRLGENDTNQKDLLQSRLQAVEALIEAYRATHPEMAQFAEELRATVAWQEKLQLAQANKKDKTNAAALRESQKEYNNLLKEQFENQKKIQATEQKIKGASSEEQKISLTGQLNALKTEQESIENKINALEMAGIENPQLKAKYQEKLNNLKTQEGALNKKNVASERNISDTIMQRLKMYIMYRGLRKIWSEATDAAQKYYDLLNEIQIVMQNSDGEIEAMSQQFKQMASDLQISATDIATSAVEFVRQGLSESETMDRTKWASMYAKVTAQEFDEASTQITATVNSMGVSAQEVVDLFVYLGDNSATSGAEVAEAFQKASAAAASFGLDINHLGAWIAAVSAKTRTDASSIGTSFNSILARWHSIKSTGYSEDEDGDVIGANDITKALSSKKVNISLFDEMGEWRDMADVLDELAGKWNTLDSVTQSYIATTMAGTRQQNTFLALMEDLAKGAEGGSIAYKLYEGSLSSAGTVSQKYQTYLESVTAAQDKMTVSLENLYSTFMNGDIMKNFYNTVSTLIENVTAGLPYINTKLLAIIAAGGTLAIVVAKIVKAVAALAAEVKGMSALKGIGTVLSSGKLGLILAGVGLIATAITTVVGAFKNAQDASRNVDFSGQITTLKSIVTNVEPLIDEYETLANKQIRTQEETEKMNELFLEIGTTSDVFAATINEVGGNTASTTEKINAMNKALLETKQLLAIVEGSEKAYSMSHASENYSGLVASQDAYEELVAAERAQMWEQAWKWYKELVDKHNKTQNWLGWSETGDYLENLGISWDDYDYAARTITVPSLMQNMKKKIITAWENEIKETGPNIQLQASQTAMEQEIKNTLSDDIETMMKGYVETAKREDISSAVASMTESQIEGARDAMIQTIQERALAEDISTVIGEESAKVMDYLTAAAVNPDYDLEYMNKYLTSWLGDSEDWSQKAQELVDKGVTTAQIELARTNWKSVGVNWSGETLAQNMFGNIKMSEIADRMLAGQYLKNVGWGGKGGNTRRFTSTSYNIGSKANWGSEKVDFDYGQDAVIEVTPVTPDGVALTPEELDKYIGEIVKKGGDLLANDEKGLILSVLPVTDGDFSGTLEANGVGASITQAAAQYTQASGSLERFITMGQSMETIMANVALDFATAAGDATAYGESVNKLMKSMINFGISEENIISLFQKMTTLMNSGALSWNDVWEQYINATAEDSENGFSGFVKWMSDTIQTLTGEDIAETAKGWAEILDGFVNNEDLGDEDSISLIESLLPVLQGITEGAGESAESLLNFSTAYNALTKTNRKTIKGMLDISDELWDKLSSGEALTAEEAEELTDALKRLKSGLKLRQLEDAESITEGIAEAFEAAEDSVMSFNKKMADVVDTVTTAKNAQSAYQYVLSNGSAGEYYEDAMSDLESYTGLSADVISTNLSYVGQIVQSEMNQAASSILNLCNAIGVLNSSSISINDAGLLTLQGTTDATTAHVVTLINTLLDAAGYKLMTEINKDAGTAELKVVNNGKSGSYTPKSASSSGGGGGGGGGGSGSGNDGNSEEERWVEEIENRLQRISDRMSQLSSIMNSWDSEGYYTAEIKALRQTNEMLEEQDGILREKIAEAQQRLPALIEEFNNTTPDTKAYDEILERVNTIQDAITDWTQELTDNEASIVSNKQKVDELKDSIRDLQLDLEEEILGAIEDREDRIDEMLQARIEMEETILDILKAQAEDAEQAILDALDAQIDALEKEKDAVSELLDARKEQAEEEDKLTELQALQTKYARIIADPTRAKDAADILEEIKDLQDEIAWSQAENENEEQQDSLDQQISSLEDYRDYIEQYYEDLLDNPRNFIDQVNGILKMSQEDILAWLMQNSDEYRNATDATREDTVNGWTDTLNQMNGVVETHWAEVQALINQGQDAVIAFLKENSADYREASKLQQEAYVDGWVDMFNSITKAYQDMEASLLDNSSFINDPKWGGSGDDSGSSSGGGGGSSSNSSTGKKWAWSLNGAQVGLKTYASREEAQKALDESVAYAKTLMNNARANMIKNGASGQAEFERLRDAYNIQAKATVAQFSKGGVADYTGLIQIDGTKASPERILSGTQTKLFDTLVKSMEQMSRISVSPMRYNGEVGSVKTGTGYTFGDINISVERLDGERDMEELADKVKDAIVKSMTKGRAVGGIIL